jgi:tetratricopeptide (TPR) repeat protein
MRSLPVVLLCTTRPLEEGTPGPKFGRHNHVVMYLDPLDRLAAEGLVDHLLEATGDHAASELRELLIDRSGGNPLFLEELVALLSEEGRLDRSSLGELPATLRGLVAARLDALSPAERATVEDASVMGRPGPVLALRSLAEGRGVTDIDDTLRSLVEKELVVVDGDRCGVKSELVREVAYGTLTKAERARRHAAIARWLSDRTQATDREDEFLESLAHHYTLAAGLAAELGHVDGVPADIVERARITLTKAASRAEGRETWLVATHLYDHLLKLVPVGERRAALIGRARARAAVSRVDEAATDAHEAIAEAEAAGDNHSLAAALVALGVAERNGRNLDKSGQHLDRAVEMFRQLGAPAGIADALRHRSMTYIFQGNAGAGEAAAREALAAYRAAGDRRGEGWCLWNLAWTSFERADYDRADERLDDALALFTDTGDQGGAAWAVGLQAWVSYFRGDLVRSEALARSVFGTAVDNGEQWASGMMQVLLANVALWRGHLHEALDRARDAHRRFLPAHDGWGQFQASTPMVRALLGVGRPGDAFAALEDLRQQAATLPPALTAGLGNITACLYLMVGDGQRALAQTMAEDRPSGLMDIERRAITGLALLQCGRPDEAVAILEDAKTVATEIGSKALTLARLTLAYAAVGRTADALAARREFDELGAGTYTDRIEMLIATLLTYARDRRPAEMEAALAEATAAADGTEDSLLQALVRLAEAVARSALGSATPEHAREARQRLALAGIGPASPAGWEVAFALAAGVTPAEASAAAS